jgi:hypothetical protein
VAINTGILQVPGLILMLKQSYREKWRRYIENCIRKGNENETLKRD